MEGGTSLYRPIFSRFPSRYGTDTLPCPASCACPPYNFTSRPPVGRPQPRYPASTNSTSHTYHPQPVVSSRRRQGPRTGGLATTNPDRTTQPGKTARARASPRPDPQKESERGGSPAQDTYLPGPALHWCPLLRCWLSDLIVITSPSFSLSLLPLPNLLPDLLQGLDTPSASSRSLQYPTSHPTHALTTRFHTATHPQPLRALFDPSVSLLVAKTTSPHQAHHWTSIHPTDTCPS